MDLKTLRNEMIIFHKYLLSQETTISIISLIQVFDASIDFLYYNIPHYLLKGKRKNHNQ